MIGKIPPTAQKLIHKGVHIGYVMPVMVAPTAIDRSLMNVARKNPRFATLTLDGVTVSMNSRSRREALRTLRAGIRRRTMGMKVPVSPSGHS